MKSLIGNKKYVVSIFVTILIILGMYSIGYADVTPVSERTPQVRDEIVDAVPGVDAAADVTEAHLAAITSLNLSRKSITSLKSGDFDGLTALVNLSLSNNQLSALPPGIFDNNTALIYLDLPNNQLSALPPGIFDNNTTLVNLSLSNNQLSALPPGIFDNNTTLRRLSLSNNQLSALPPGIFDNNTALQALDLVYNQLSALPPGIFSGLSSMIWIRVDNNQLTTLPEDAFSGLSSLTSLYLNSNKLSSLPEDTFSGLSSLTELRLESNNLSSLPEGIFSGLSSLTSLNLYRNNLSSLPEGIFSGLSSLTTINLEWNQLSNLPSDIFSGLSLLTTINLGTNQLSSLPEGIFSGLSSLTSLNLNQNAAELSIIVLLQEVTANQFKVMVRPGAPFNIVVPINVMNGSIDGGGTIVTIPTGSVESEPFTVTPIPGTSAAITVEIGTLPSIPSDHRGYSLIQLNRAPEFTEGPITTRTVAEDTTAGINIGTAVSATDVNNDLLTYTLSGADANFFTVDNTTGQLRTSSTLDYETKPTYTVTVTVTDGTFTSSIIVTINVTDVEPETFYVSEPRTVRLFYYLPNDRPYRQEVVDAMKTGIIEIQSFYAEQMEAHGHGNMTFQIETDAQGDPIVHRVDGANDNNYYDNRRHPGPEIDQAFDNSDNVHVIVMDINRGLSGLAGGGNKNTRWAIVYGGWNWRIAAHELGHAFGLLHDFRDDAYLMSYGSTDQSSTELSAFAADFLSVQPYFNPDISLEIESPPTFELLSPTIYLTGAESVPIRLRVRDDDGIHQVILLVKTSFLTWGGGGGKEVKTYRKLAGETDTIVEFDYDGKNPSGGTSLSHPLRHEIYFMVVDTEGNNAEGNYTGSFGWTVFTLEGLDELYPLAGRTRQVQDAIVAAVPDIDNAADVTEAHLATITSLDLSWRSPWRLLTLKTGDFSGLSALTTLSLGGNDLTSLPEGVFSGLSSLTTLDLNSNDLTSLPQSVFSGLSSLTTINLNSNDLTSLPEGVFSSLLSLTTINLNSNDLTSLPEGVFSGLSSLTTLDLRYNDLTSLPEGVFSGLSSLTTLDLRYNDLTSLPEGVFSGLSSLTTLWLNSNDLTSLPEGVFSGLSSLTTLILSSNDLTSLPEGVFSGLSSVTSLNLWGNAVEPMPLPVSLEKVGDDQFKAVAPAGAPFDIVLPLTLTNGSISGGAPTVTILTGSTESKVLTVTRTPDTTGAVTVNIRRVPLRPSGHTGYALVKSADLPLSYPLPEVNTFLGRRTPQVLDAIVAAVPSVNNVADVTEVHVAAITELNLHTKHIKTLKEGDFDGLSALTTLDLSHNSLTELPAGVFNGLSALTTLSFHSNRLTELPAGVFNGLSALTTLNLYNNRLTELSAGVFNGLSALTTLWLSLNPGTPLPLNVSLDKVGTDQFKAVAPTGATFNIEVPLTVTNGGISGSATTVTIPKGSVESEVLTVTRTPGTTGAVTVNIGTLPSLPQKHFGYALVKSANLPLSYALPEIRILIANRTPEVRDAIVEAVPDVNSANDITDAHLAAITSIDFTLNNSVKVGDFEGLTGLTTLGLDTGQLTSLPTGLFNDLSKVTYMEMYGEQLTTLPAGAFDGLTGLTQLVLTSLQLTSLPAGVFDPLTSLTASEIMAGQLNTLPANIFDQLTNLTYLLFYGGQLNTLPDDVFDQLTKLTELSLFSDRLTSLPDGVLDELTQLTSLGIGRTRLTSLPDGLFSGLSSLTSLNLSGNAVDPMPLTVSLEKVAAGQFKAVAPIGAPFEIVLPLTVTNGSITDGVTTLTIPKGSVGSEVLTVTRAPGTTYAVSVNIGNLPSLPTETVRGFRLHRGYTLVKSIDLPLEFGELGGRTFIPVSQRTPQVRDKIVEAVPGVNSAADVTKEHLAAITGLGLGRITLFGNTVGEEITTLQAGDFDGLTGMTTLWINGEQQLSNVPTGIFNGLSSLETLTLTGNFSSLPDGVFDGLTSLTFLTVGGPQLSSLSANIFDELTSLTTLAVGGGRLNNLPMGVFNELTNLTKLFLIEGTPLGSNLPAGIFDKLATLTELYLEGIQLTALPVGIFDKLTALTRLSLENNQLTSLPAGIFDQLTALKHLYLNSNELSSLPAGVFDELTALTGLGLSHNQLSSLPDGVFHELTALTTLRLHKNQLSSLPDDVFHGLTALTELLLYGNTVDPLPLTVSLEKVADGQFKAVVPAGAPFDIVLPISVSYGSISGSATTITIPTGSVESEVLTVTRTSTDPASVNIGTLPRLPFSPAPADHSGYILVKSDALPLEVISGQSKIGEQGRPGTANEAPVFTDGTTTTRTIAANTAAGVNIGTPVAATDANNDTLTYTLSGTDAASFGINSSSGQLQTKTALDYETKTAYTVTITVSDGKVTDTITVTINITDVADTPIVPALTPVSQRTPQVQDAIVAAVPGVNSAADITKAHLAAITTLNLSNKSITSLKIGDFDGLSGLTRLVLEGNRLTTLPSDIFDGLTALKNIDLNVNDLTSLPADIFEGLTALNTIGLGGNDLTTLPAGIFDGLGLTSLMWISLTYNDLTTLPDGIFEGLTSLTHLYLYDNPVDPLPLTVALEKVADGQFKAVVPAGAPFDIVLPLTVTNGYIRGGTTSITLSTGSVESDTFTVTRTAGTTANVTVNIGTLPSRPRNHFGYFLVKSADLPLYALPEIRILIANRTPQVRDAIIAAVPGVDNAADVTEAHLAAITLLDFGFKSIRSLTAGDFDGLTALEWLNLPNDTQLSTLPAGIFNDLTALTSLNLSRIQLSTLPAGIFDKLVNLKRLYLTSNQLSSLPAGIFDKLTNLTELYLDGNPLSTLPADIFDKLTALTKLELDENQLSTLPVGIFDKLSDLTFLNLYNNQLSSLPVGIFDRLTNLTNLYLSDNPGSPFSLTVSLEKVADGQFKAVVPTGAPFDFVLPLTVTNGTIYGGATSITIAAGSVESSLLTVGRTVGTIANVTVDIGTLPGLPANHQGYTLVKSADLPLVFTELAASTFTPLSERTQQISGEVMRIQGLNSADDVTEVHIAGIGGLNLRGRGITSLKSGDFDGFSTLTHLHLNQNQLSELPDDIFSGLSTLTYLDLSSNQLSGLPDGVFNGLSTLRVLLVDLNTVDPLPLTVSLEKVADGQFKAGAPAGAPFEMVLPLTVTNGSIVGSASTITIPAGSMESDTLTVTRTAGTTAAVTVNIGTLPDLPADHEGYELVKSDALPLEVISATAPQVRSVNIPDANLRAKIESALGKTSGDPITTTEMATLTTLNAQSSRITNLTGLETATSLTTLKLGDNTISNISALSGLTKLTELHLWDNQITNLSALSELTDLTKLYLWGNSISDISHLSGLTNLRQLRIGENSISNISAVARLTNLTYLSLKENAISNISALARLTNLTELQIGNNTITDIDAVKNLTKLAWLDMPNNRISDISAVQNLTSLRELYFQNNAVSDLSPLVANAGFGESTELNASGNPLSYPSIYTHIPALQAKNVYIEFDNRVATTPVKISGDTQSEETGTTLAQPFVVEVRDGSRVAFAGVPVTFAVTAGGGRLSATNTTTDTNGRAESTLTLGNTAGANTVRVSVAGITQTITFTATATTTNTAPVFTDGTSTTRAIAENTAAGISIGTAIAATDADNDALTYTLSGADAAAFSIDNNTGQLRSKSALDYETKQTYTVIVTVSDGNLTDTITITINVTDIPEVSLTARFEALPASHDGSTFTFELHFSEKITISYKNVRDDVLDVTGGTVKSAGRLEQGSNRGWKITIEPESNAEVSIVLLPTEDCDAVGAVCTTDGHPLSNELRVIVPGPNIREDPGTVSPIINHTPQVRDAIVAALPGINSVNDVTEAHLATITSLDLRNKGISTLNAGDLDGLTALTELRLQGNQLRTLPANIFADMSSLKTLDLGNNQLTSLSPEVFSGLTAVTDLHIHNNQLATLPQNLFSGMSSLTQINIHSNRLRSIHEDAFSGLPSLTQLFLRNNRLTSLPHDVFSGLSRLQYLYLDGNQLTDLSTDVFSGLSSLIQLLLNGNQLSTLPAGAFRGLTRLTTLRLQANSVNPMPLTVSLEKVGVNQFKATAPAGAPFAIILPVRVANGSISGGATTLTIPQGAVESAALTVRRTLGTTRAVTVDIGTFPGLPAQHQGYELVKSTDLPLTIFSAPSNSAPVFTDGTSTTRTIAENTAAGINIGTAITATDAENNILTYTLNGPDAGSFDLHSTTGQLKTKAALDYETKASYTVTITVSDGSLTDTIDVTINITEIDDTPQQPDTPEQPIDTTGAPTLSVSTAAPLTEVTLHEGIVTLTLNGGTYEQSSRRIRNAVSVSGITGIAFDSSDTQRISDTQATIKLEFNGNINTHSTLTITLGAGAIADYNGAALTAQIPVTAVSESVAASTAAPLTGATLDESVVTLTLSGRKLERWNSTIRRAVSVTGITDVTVRSSDIDRQSDTEVTVELTFNGNLNTDGTLTFTVGPDAIVGYNGPALTAQVSVSASEAPVEIVDRQPETPQDDTPPPATDTRVAFEASTPPGYTRVTLKTTGRVWGIPTKYTTDSDVGAVAYMALAKLMGCNFADAEVARRSIVYIKRQTLGSLSGFVSGTVCGKTSSTWPTDWDGVRITHLRFYDEMSLPNIKEAVYNSATDQIALPGTWQQPPDDTANTAPVFTDGASTRRAIAENTAAGRNIGTAIAATDADNDALTYTLGGTDAVVFSINSNTGQLRTKSALDYETKHAYTVKITVSDGNLTDTITVTINVTDIAETIVGATAAAPSVKPGDSNTELVISFEDTFAAFETKAYEIKLRRKTPPGDWNHGCDTIRNNGPGAGTATASFVIKDLEPGTTYQVRYRDTNQAFCPHSAANNNPNSWSAIGEGKTSGERPQTNTAPAFADGATTTRTIAENTTAGANIGTAITAADADNDALTYTLGGTDAAAFNIGRTTGQLKTKSTLDYETKRTYTVKITVSDGSLTDVITVTINVTDINEKTGDKGGQQPGDKGTPEQPIDTTGTPTLSVSTAAPLTEATLHEGIVTLTLNGGTYEQSSRRIRTAVSVAGITGIAFDSSDTQRISDTQATIKLEFNGNINTHSTLTITLGAGAIADYNGAALTAQIPVTAVSESVAASTASPLTEATLDESIITLTLSGRKFERWNSTIRRAVSVSGISGVTVRSSDIDRQSDTEVTVELTFNGNLNTDGTLTFTVGAGAIAGYNGPAFTAQVAVSASEAPVEIVDQQPETPQQPELPRLTARFEALPTSHDGSTFTFKLHFSEKITISYKNVRDDVLDVTGGTVENASRLKQGSNLGWEITIKPESNAAVSIILLPTDDCEAADAVCTTDGRPLSNELRVIVPGPDTSEDPGNVGRTPTVSVSTTAPLTEATLHEGIVTLTLRDGTYEQSSRRIRNAVSVSGITGIAFDSFDTQRISDTQATIKLEFNGNINTHSTLTITLGAGAIADYNGAALTAQIPVTAVYESVTTSTAAPLTEATLDESIVTLTLNGRKFEVSNSKIRRAVSVSGISGVTVRSADIDRINDTQVTVELTFNGNLNADGTLTLTVGAAAIAGYNGPAFTAQVSVSASEAPADTGGQNPDPPETRQQPGDRDTPQQPVNTGGTPTLTASTSSPLTEATLNGSSVTLTLSGAKYERSKWDIVEAVQVAGIRGVTLGSSTRVQRVSDMEVTVELEFNGNISTGSTLTFTLGAAAIADYNGSALTARIAVSANTESVTASAASPLTEATLDEGIVILTLRGAKYSSSIFDIRDAVSVSGINGVTKPWSQPERKSDTELTVELEFDGTNFDTTSTLTFTVNADAIAGYNGPALTTQISVTAVTESVVASTPAPLKEATLDGSVVTLTLSGAKYAGSIWDIRDGVTVSGITGVTMPWNQPDRKSDTQITVELEFDGNMNTDGTLTFTVGADAIAGYNGPTLTAQVTVTADRENALLANFPNPFNPETWIPYQLAKPAEVTITIYAIDGQVVRRLVLGHQTEGMYQSRSRAAYWDGKNAFGEPVASGVYFYRLTASDFSATQKMLIRK